MNPTEPRQIRWPLFVSIALLVFCAVVYHVRPGGLAAIYIWPLTLWVVFGISLAWLALRVPARWKVAVTLLWLVGWFGLDEQAWAFAPRVATPESENIVVGSLNCAGGIAAAAEEAVATGADVILLQESPSRAEIEAIRTRLSTEQKVEWTAVIGPDATILTSLPVRPVELPKGTSNFVAAQTERDFIISLRLAPPVFRLDYWSPDCWRDYSHNRNRRKAELDEIVAWVKPRLKGRRLILGGDFNIPNDHWVQASLRELARDSFSDAGRGWGGTAINTMPLVRIDQIWFGGWRAWESTAFTSAHSDHRGVIARAGWED